MKKTRTKNPTKEDYVKLQLISNLKNYVDELKEDKAKKVLEKIENWMWEYYPEYIPVSGSHEPSLYELKFEYVTTINYRGEEVDIFADDYGQQYYFYYKNKNYSCGSFNLDYEGYVKYIIDQDLDTICNFEEKGFYGAYCKYADWEHTKVDFIFRDELVETFTVNKDDPESVYKIWKECESRLEKLQNNPEFIKAEEERKAKGNLYFSEFIHSDEESGK